MALGKRGWEVWLRAAPLGEAAWAQFPVSRFVEPAIAHDI